MCWGTAIRTRPPLIFRLNVEDLRQVALPTPEAGQIKGQRDRANQKDEGCCQHKPNRRPAGTMTVPSGFHSFLATPLRNYLTWQRALWSWVSQRGVDFARIGSGVALRLSVRTRLYQSDVRPVGARTGRIVTHRPSAPDVMRGQVLPLLGSDAADNVRSQSTNLSKAASASGPLFTFRTRSGSTPGRDTNAASYNQN
jgi:hypothetical protein